MVNVFPPHWSKKPHHFWGYFNTIQDTLCKLWTGWTYQMQICYEHWEKKSSGSLEYTVSGKSTNSQILNVMLRSTGQIYVFLPNWSCLMWPIHSTNFWLRYVKSMEKSILHIYCTKWFWVYKCTAKCTRCIGNCSEKMWKLFEWPLLYTGQHHEKMHSCGVR